MVMASPGMLQSGLSRELFETWCPDPKNSVIMAGYCVEGTLAKMIMSEPEEVHRPGCQQGCLYISCLNYNFRLTRLDHSFKVLQPQILSLNGAKLPLKSSVHYISFSAHTDYEQTSGTTP